MTSMIWNLQVYLALLVIELQMSLAKDTEKLGEMSQELEEP